MRGTREGAGTAALGAGGKEGHRRGAVVGNGSVRLRLVRASVRLRGAAQPGSPCGSMLRLATLVTFLNKK